MNALRSRLCWGEVVHRRYRPKLHALRYRVFSVLIDLDEASTFGSTLRLFSFNKRNFLSLFERDHGDGSATGLKKFIVGKVNSLPGGDQIERVSMLCFPRQLGYAFNPLTVYYCYGPKNDLQAVVYEVNNTFGDRQHYVLRASTGASGRVAHSCDKQMHVSPFNAVEGTYEFHLAEPGERFAVGVNLRVNGMPVLKAYHCGQTEALTDRNLGRVLLAMPLMTVKVIIGIHFEALLLWAKGLPVFRRSRPAQNYFPYPQPEERIVK